MKRLAGASLSWQLLKSVLSIYFSITLLVTLTQMAVEFVHARDTIRRELVSAEQTFYPALATALWEINEEQLDALQKGIVDLPGISEVRVVDVAGRERVKNAGDKPLGRNISHRFAVSYPFSGEDVFLANVTFETTGMVVFERVKLGFQMIVISALVKSAALTLLFFWAFHRRLGVPLQQLTQAVSTVDLETLQRQYVDFKQPKTNELSTLESAFNRMLDRLDAERKEHMAALEATNKSLETQVVQRTEELAAANQYLEQLVRTDPLTGVANRRHFTEQAQQEIERARRNAQPLSLLMIDLDHFKYINDDHGHAMGDEVLRNFSATVRNPLRTTDLVARIGGEEFVVLLPNTALPGAQEVAQRILDAVRCQVLSCENGLLHYTTSIGVANLHEGEASYETLLSRADKALYRAKSTGRNQALAEA